MNKRVLQIQGIISALAIVGLTYGRVFNVPDAFSRLYGLPLRWGVHQLSTIAGPVDYWNVNLTFLIIDLAFWLLIILLVPVIISDKKGN